MARASVLAGASDTLFMVEAIVASQPVWLAGPSNNATGSLMCVAEEAPRIQ